MTIIFFFKVDKDFFFSKLKKNFFVLKVDKDFFFKVKEDFFRLQSL